MFKKMKCSKTFATVFCAVVLVSGGLQVSAQEISADHITAAKRAISTTNATTKLNDILPRAAARLTGTLISNRPDIEAEITVIVNDTALEMAPRRGDLEKEAAKIYARIFTQQELDNLSEFFGTDTGKKFLKDLPIVVREIDAAARVWGTGINRDLSQTVGKKMKEAGLQ